MVRFLVPVHVVRFLPSPAFFRESKKRSARVQPLSVDFRVKDEYLHRTKYIHFQLTWFSRVQSCHE
jgi:hypothetical protein